MTTAYIGLGTNEGDRLANLASAIQALSGLPGTHVDRVSHAYESEPAYLADQPWFANAVAQVTTSLQPAQLLGHLDDIERRLGRVRVEKNGPRVIDLDILLFGAEELNTPDLTIPHPLLLEREFAVVPLLDIAPSVVMPDGSPVSSDGATLGKVVGDLGPVHGGGAAGGEPVAAPDWVEVSSCEAANDVMSGWNAAISLQREVLQEAGIPYAFDPYDPDDVMDPFGMPRTFKILVPADYAEQAERLIADVMKAKPEFPEEYEAPVGD